MTVLDLQPATALSSGLQLNVPYIYVITRAHSSHAPLQVPHIGLTSHPIYLHAENKTIEMLQAWQHIMCTRRQSKLISSLRAYIDKTARPLGILAIHSSQACTQSGLMHILNHWDCQPHVCLQPAEFLDVCWESRQSRPVRQVTNAASLADMHCHPIKLLP